MAPAPGLGEQGEGNDFKESGAAKAAPLLVIPDRKNPKVRFLDPVKG